MADVVGYFSRPQAAALDCMQVEGEVFGLPADFAWNVESPTCPTGYAAMLGSCEVSNLNGVLFGHKLDPDTQKTVCFFRNTGSTLLSMRADAHCCRSPGR